MSNPVYTLSQKALYTAVGEDIVALNVDDGQCYGMEKVSASIWSILAKSATLDEICDRLISRYEVDPKVCRAEVEKLMIEFQSEGLIEAVRVP